MKRYVALLLMLTGCAHDNYTVIPDSNGSQAQMASDLYDCKMEAGRIYDASKPNTSGVSAVAGVLGGAIGGAIAGVALSDNGSMKVSEINPYVGKCMKSKGYSGTSS